jgi:hypothetical protein
MRRVGLILIIAILVIIAVLGVTAAVLATNGDLHPGGSFFPLQFIAEQVDARLFTSAETRAERYLVFAERRLDDLKFSTGTDRELQALVFLNAAVDQAASAVPVHPKRTPDACFGA